MNEHHSQITRRMLRVGPRFVTVSTNTLLEVSALFKSMAASSQASCVVFASMSNVL
jgi:hypothetical protein